MTALAGSFTSDFSDPNQPGFTLNPGGAYPVVASGRLVLTQNQNSQQGTITFEDLDGGQPIESFTARFKLQIGPGSGNPADGVSFCFGPGLSANFGEEGSGNGVIIAFDTYDNGASEAPAIDVKYGGATIASTKFAKADMVTSRFEDVVIQVNRGGRLNMVYKGQILYTNLVLPAYAPQAGQFAIGARTGGENANQWIDDLNITTVVAAGDVAPSVTAPPQSVTVNEGADATFSVGYDGSAPLTFRWLKNGFDIEGGDGPTVTLRRVPFTDHNAAITVEISNPAGSVTSDPAATLRVIRDTTPPTLVKAEGSGDFTHVTVTFSEPVSPETAELAGNYQIAGLTVDAATLDPIDDRKVLLTTSQQGEGVLYTLIVSGVKDISSAGNTIQANSQTQFRSYVFSQGFLAMAIWNGIGGTAVSALTGDPRYQAGAYDQLRFIPGKFDSTPTYQADNYGAEITGFIVPEEDGNYHFFLRSDDASQLWLSSDDTMDNLVMIAQETGCCNAFQEPGAAQTSQLIPLVANQRYAVKALVKEAGGGDYIVVAWRKEGDQTPAGNLQPIPGKYFGTFVNPAGASITITTQPADAQAEVGKTATFSVEVTASSSSIGYQWKKNGVDIPNATDPSYTTPTLLLADNNSRYSVVVAIPGASVTSREANLRVTLDATPPTLVGGGSLLRGETVEIGLKFNEALDAESAGNAGNYTLSKGSVVDARFVRYSGGITPGTPPVTLTGTEVVLTVSGVSGGDTVTVSVRGVKDLVGNAIPAGSPATRSVKITSTLRWAPVGGTDYVDNDNEDPALWPDDAVAVGERDFDLISGGSGHWDTYEEQSFVYEEVTGDFDKVLRVEYHDPTSQWARAGLQVRAAVNEGVKRSEIGTTPLSRNATIRVNPKTQWNNAAGNNGVEFIYRSQDGGTYTGPGGGTPTYPNAWVRLTRTGQVIEGLRSTNGIDWISVGNYTFVEPNQLPEVTYVGPFYAPEMNNNNTRTGIGHSAMARVRDYGDYQPPAPRITAITRSGGNVTVMWTGGGELQTATSLAGPWTGTGDTDGSFTQALGAGTRFYRARIP
jgi:hypothetical protein